MKIRYLILFMTLAVAAGCSIISAKPQRADFSTEFTNQTGIQWGSSEKPEFELVPVTSEGSLETFRAGNFKVELGRHVIEDIYVGYCNGAFCGLIYAFTDSETGKAIRNKLSEKYGAPATYKEYGENGEFFVWTTQELELTLHYDIEGALKIRYTALLN